MYATEKRIALLILQLLVPDSFPFLFSSPFILLHTVALFGFVRILARTFFGNFFYMHEILNKVYF